MNPDRTNISVIVNSHCKNVEGEIFVSPLSHRERLRNTWRRAVVLFGCMVFSIFLPLVHFVLVPGFFLAAIIVGVVTYRTAEEWETVFTCAECTKPVSIVVYKRKFPMVLTCPSCGVTLWVRNSVI